MLYSVLNSKQKQLHGHKSNKMRESTLSWIGNFEEKVDLSYFYLAVQCHFLGYFDFNRKFLPYRKSKQRKFGETNS